MQNMRESVWLVVSLNQNKLFFFSFKERKRELQQASYHQNQLLHNCACTNKLYSLLVVAVVVMLPILIKLKCIHPVTTSRKKCFLCWCCFVTKCNRICNLQSGEEKSPQTLPCDKLCVRTNNKPTNRQTDGRSVKVIIECSKCITLHEGHFFALGSIYHAPIWVSVCMYV